MRSINTTTCNGRSLGKMASMEKEYFWGKMSFLKHFGVQCSMFYLRSFVGCELSKDKKEYKWDSEDEELGKADIEQKLVVTQVHINYHSMCTCLFSSF